MSRHEKDLHALASQPLRVTFLAHIHPDAVNTLSRFADLLESAMLETMPVPEGPAPHNVVMTRAAVPDLMALERLAARCEDANDQSPARALTWLRRRTEAEVAERLQRQRQAEAHHE